MEENQKNKKPTNKLLDILLTIIVLITVISGGVIYYYLYKYSKEEIIENATENSSSSVAEIINTAIDPNSSVFKDSSNSENTISNTNTTVSTGEIDDRKVLNEEIIVLYDGLILDAKEMGLVDLKFIDNSSNSKDNYVVTYYNYENYEFKNSTLGVLSSQVLEGLVKIDNVGKVSISEKYNAIPRDVQVVNSVPSIVLDNNSNFSNYDSKKTIIVDLDGDGTNEYVVILSSKESGESKIILAEATGIVKAELARMDKSGWDVTSTNGYYLSYNNIEVIDIDNDGIMEILFEVPSKDVIPNTISVLKYKNGELSGKTDVECTLVKENK